MIKIDGTSEEFDKHLLKVHLDESKEPMAVIDTKGLDILLQFDSTNSKHTWALRISVLNSLVESAKDFQKIGYTLKLMDAYRSLKTQEDKFLNQVNLIKRGDVNISDNDAMLLVNTYIAGIPILAAHTAGAAIDVILLDKRTNEIVDMGCEYLNLSVLTITSNTRITKKQAKNREVLKTVLEKHGFSNYPFEYWHYSIDDVCATYLRGGKYAKFGPVNYNYKNNKTIYPRNNISLYSFFGKKYNSYR